MNQNSPKSAFPPVRSAVAGRVERAPAPGLLLVEDETQTAAEEVFRALNANSATRGLEVTELSRGLFFVQAKATGRYWRFAPFHKPSGSPQQPPPSTPAVSS